MGREFLLLDAEMQRLPELPREVVGPDLEKAFERFLDTFVLEDYAGMVTASEEDLELASGEWGGESGIGIGIGIGDRVAALYTRKLLRFLEARGCGERVAFGVSLQHLHAFSPTLFAAVVNAPQDATAAFDALLRSKFAQLRELHGLFLEPSPQHDELLLQQAPRLRFHSKPALLMDSLRCLDPTVDIERLVCLKGVVIRVSEVIPEMTLAAFRCHARDPRSGGQCLHEVYACVLNGDVVQPQRCSSCGAVGSLALWLQQSAFASKQLIKVAEVPELLSPGETPQSLTVYAYDDLVDACRPGDRVEIT
ncbi:hypothetical protein, conserved, partial [Eimeria tenella]